MWNAKVFFARAGLAVMLVSGMAAPALAQAAGARVTIMSVVPGAQAQTTVMVKVHNEQGQGIARLSAANFVIEEQGHVVPSELIAAMPIRAVATPPTVGIVADMSDLIGKDTVERMRADTTTLIDQLVSANASVDLAVFVPRDNGIAPKSRKQASAAPPVASQNQNVVVHSFDAPARDAGAAFSGLPARMGQTSFYNAISTAINESAQQAQKHDGAAYVIIVGDGIDRTSIVGATNAGANEVARLAEEKNVQIIALGYGKGLQEGGVVLNQITDRTKGSYYATPDRAALSEIAQTIKANTTTGVYQLQYASALPADGAQHDITVRVQADGFAATATAQYLVPRPWDERSPTQLDVRADAASYPRVTLFARPVNRLRRTVPALTATDFTVLLDGQPVRAPLTVNTLPLDANDAAATQSVALVLDSDNGRVQKLAQTAIALLGAPALADSRMALFIPGAAPENESLMFTHDHNALINSLRQSFSRDIAPGSLGTTLQRAIEQAAQDGDAVSRPAYVVLLTDTQLPLDEYARVFTHARNLGVTLHVVTPRALPAMFGYDTLAEATHGSVIVNPDQARLDGLAAQIAQDRATLYSISFDSPALADGKERQLTVQAGSTHAATTLTPLIAGAVQPVAPFPLASQVAIGLVVALLLGGGALLPRMLHDRRLRCPTCQRVRRASWGNTCLFCELNGLAQPERHTDVPLEGFTVQGASLARQPVAGLAAAPTPMLEPFDGEAVTKIIQQGDFEDSDETHAAAPVVAEAIVSPADQAVIQTHTDFWGALPGESDTETFEAIDQAAVSAPAAPASAPPPMPVFEYLSRSAWPHQYVRTAPDSVREPAHTDFWGAMPEDEQADAPAAVAPVAATPDQSSDDDQAESTTDFWGVPAPTTFPNSEDRSRS